MASGPNLAGDLNISLEPHLLEVLEPLPPLLPTELSTQLSAIIDRSPRPPSPPTISNKTSGPVAVQHTIPYALLSAISQWSRTPAGHHALLSLLPSLDPASYNMIALLAGTRTSPERKFPAGSPATRLDGRALSIEDAKRNLDDRRAVTAVLNALLSILGSGAATWWAAERLAWKDEWKVLLALLVAMVVAISEAVLYLIWDGRRSKRKPPPRVQSSSAHKKNDGHRIEMKVEPSGIAADVQTRLDAAGGLRERVPVTPRVSANGTSSGS